MDKEIRHPDGRIEHPQVRHEKRDVPFHWLLILFLVLCAVGAVQFVLIRSYFHTQEHNQSVRKASPYPLAPRPSGRLPEGPRLEQIDRLAGIESANVHDREMASQRILSTYGHTPDKGFIRIPIWRAMHEVLHELPVRKQQPSAQPPQDDGLLFFGDPNSGRVFRETPR